MRKLLEFLIGKRHWFLFILLEAVSLMLVYRNNAYQRNIIFSSANVVTGYIASISGSVTSYLNLRDINKELLERNGQLELQMLDLQDQLDALIALPIWLVLRDSRRIRRSNFLIRLSWRM